MAIVQSREWKAVRPSEQVCWEALEDFSLRVPTADWFWISLQRLCVPGCCGLAAYDFSHGSVRWACGDDVDLLFEPGTSDWRDDEPGNPVHLAEELRALAADLRHSKAAGATASEFDDVLTPASYAELFEDLARKLVNPSRSTH